MLVALFNAVKVESVPLNSSEFCRAHGEPVDDPVHHRTGGHYAAFLDGEEQAADVLVSFLDHALAPRADGPADEYVTGGEPGVAVADRTRQTEIG